jgi:small subunit ribosomal protein S4
MNHTGPKVKLSRRVGIPLTRRAAKSMERRPGAPGMHRSRFSKKVSDYGRQLLEKQRLRYQYNITERKLRNYYLKAAAQRGNTAKHLIEMLETRLDAIVFRAGLAPTIHAARQLVGHGHILVNNKRTDIASFAVQPNHVITVREKTRNNEMIKSALQSVEDVPYINVDRDNMVVTLTRIPEMEEVPVVCELSVVVEYYSK